MTETASEARVRGLDTIDIGSVTAIDEKITGQYRPDVWERRIGYYLRRDPDAALVAEVDGEVVGFWMIAKDVNRVLRRIPSGRLWPWNVLRLLRGIPRTSNHRIVLLGVKREYRHQGLLALFAYEASRRGLEAREEGAEASWILEHNEALIRPLTSLGYEPYKRWRLYEKALEPLG